MTVAVLTAVADATVDAALVSALSADTGVRVVRRCVDIADLLAAAAAGLGRVAVVSGDLRRLDQDAVMRLALDGIAVVGVVAPGDAAAEQRLLQLGVREVLAASAAPAAIAAAVRDAASGAEVGPSSADDPPPPFAEAAAGREGRVFAVWGPTGAPGRSSIAVGIAAEMAALGLETLLVDADVYGAVVAQLLGLLDESPGLAAACRLANNGSLGRMDLVRIAVEVRPHLRVLTGIARAERWPEIRPAGVETVLALARELADVTIVDCGFSLELDEELSFDTAAPRRNGATVAVLENADRVIAVAAGDPVGLQRFTRGLSELGEVVPGADCVTVVNRVRASAIGGGNPEREIAAALERFAGVTAPVFVPDDPKAFDAAVAAGQTLPEIAPSAPARHALQQLAAGLVNRPVQRGRGRLRRR